MVDARNYRFTLGGAILFSPKDGIDFVPVVFPDGSPVKGATSFSTIGEFATFWRRNIDPSNEEWEIHGNKAYLVQYEWKYGGRGQRKTPPIAP